jgi:regulator of sigma E protease
MRYPLWQAPFRGIVHTFQFVHDYLVIIGKMIIGAIQPQFSGPVGIAQVTQSVAAETPTVGWWPILSLTAALSLNLAIFNILPFPALDGGRIFLILVELLRGGKRLKPEREGLINLVGFALLLVLMVVVTVSDIMHWGS